jgi:uncharacterized protein (DUF1697 family)
MTRWAALLRGVNAGVKLPMADWRAFLAGQGMGDVKTLLASGNAVFTTEEGDAALLESKLSAAMKHTLGIDTGWFLRSHAELQAIVQANPFPDAAAAHPNHLQVHFCHDAVDPKLIATVAEIYDGPERLHAVGRELYVDYPVDIGNSKLPHAMNKVKLAAGATGRNWNTILKLVALTAPTPAG